MNFFNDILNPAELVLLEKFHDSVRCGFSDAVMPYISSLCKAGVFWILLAAVLVLFRKTRRTGVSTALALILGFVLCNLILKPLCVRIRPYELDPEITLLISKETDFSFPSGHTMSSFASAAAIFMNSKKWGIAAFVLAALIAFSRLYLLMHFFTDVIAAAVLGTVCGVCAYFIGKVLIVKTKMPV